MIRNSILSLLTAFVSFGTLSPAFSAEFFLPNDRSAVKVGDTFSVPVTLSPSGSQIDTARVVLNYDPTKLKATGFRLVSALDNSAPASFIDHSGGVISWGGFDMVDRISSTTMFGIASFQALASGSSTVSLSPTSHIISGGQEVGVNNNDSLAVNISSSEEKYVADDEANPIAISAPEYDYKIIRSSFLCGYIPQVCAQPWWIALVSMLLLVTGILLLLISHPHLSSKTTKDEAN